MVGNDDGLVGVWIDGEAASRLELRLEAATDLARVADGLRAVAPELGEIARAL